MGAVNDGYGSGDGSGYGYGYGSGDGYGSWEDPNMPESQEEEQ